MRSSPFLFVLLLCVAGCGANSYTFASTTTASAVVLDGPNQKLGGGRLPPGTPGMTIHGYHTEMKSSGTSQRQEGSQTVTTTSSSAEQLSAGAAAVDWELLVNTKGRYDVTTTGTLACGGSVFFALLALVRGHTCLLATEVHAPPPRPDAGRQSTTSAAVSGASFAIAVPSDGPNE